jgi:hypothetical protein
VVIANMAGTLVAGSELSDGSTEGAIYFHFEDAGTGFILWREAFDGAGFHDRRRSTLVVRLRAVKLWIDQEPEQ